MINSLHTTDVPRLNMFLKHVCKLKLIVCLYNFLIKNRK